MLKQIALAVPPIRRLWNERAALIEERDTLKASAPRLFELAYGRAPGDQAHSLAGLTFSAASLRSLIASTDRQTYPSPITVRFGRDDIALAAFEGVKLWLDRMDLAVSASVLAGGAYEPHMVAFLRAHVQPGMTVVDIGANVGIFTMLAASIGATVHAFEPNTENCRLILLSKDENGFENIHLHPLALSDETGALFFSPHIGSNGGILPNRSETLFDPNCIVVPSARLDDLVQGPVNFIKADVEGAEYLALKGGERIIREHKPIITIELSMEMSQRVSGIDGIDFIRWVQAFGYRSFLIGRNGEPTAIGDLNQLARDWRDTPRIEDVAFIPV